MDKNISVGAEAPPLTAGHTPGRWVVNLHEQGQYAGNIHSELGIVADLMTIRTIAVILKYAPPDECAANARLIAAAPELLAALKKLTAFVGNMSFHPKAEDRHADDLVDAAETAIAKAEGR